MLLDILVDWLSDNLGQLGPPIFTGELNPEGRYLLGMSTPTNPSPLVVKRELRKLGNVASFKYLIDWPAGLQVYVVMPNAGVTAEAYLAAAYKFADAAVLRKGNHPIFYSVQWDLSGKIEHGLEYPWVELLVAIGLVALVVWAEQGG